MSWLISTPNKGPAAPMPGSDCQTSGDSPIADSHTPYPTRTLPGVMLPREKHTNTLCFLRYWCPDTWALCSMTPAAAHTDRTWSLTQESNKKCNLTRKSRHNQTKHNDQQPIRMRLVSFLSTYRYFLCLFVCKQPSPSCSCLWSLPLKPISLTHSH